MQIERETCVGCGQCIPYCPVGAILLHPKDKENGKKAWAEVNLDECVECGNCLRMAGCPTNAFVQQELVYPRTVRSILSDPLTVAVESGISGRGTEEMKTNEVTGRFQPGWVGIAVELGRPILGARLYDVEKVAMACASLGVTFEKVNPTTSMMADPTRGTFKPELLNEKVLSAIIEFAIELERLPQLFDALEKVSGQIETVFSLDMATRVRPDGVVPTATFLKERSLWVAPNGKTNTGLGRPRIEETIQ